MSGIDRCDGSPVTFAVEGIAAEAAGRARAGDIAATLGIDMN